MQLHPLPGGPAALPAGRLVAVGGGGAGPVGAAALELLSGALGLAPVALLADDSLLPLAAPANWLSAQAPAGPGIVPAGQAFALAESALLLCSRSEVATGSSAAWGQRLVDWAVRQRARSLLVLEGIGAGRRRDAQLGEGAGGARLLSAASPAVPARAAEACGVAALEAAERAELLQASALLRALVAAADRQALPLSVLLVYAQGDPLRDGALCARLLCRLLDLAPPAALPPPHYALGAAQGPAAEVAPPAALYL